MYYQDQPLPVRDSIATSHAAGFAAFSRAGSWFSGSERNAILEEARLATDCDLCMRRKAALSPYAVKGVHDSLGQLPNGIVEVIHRVKTDSGRLTESWFNSVVGADLNREAYVEIVGAVATSIILDSFATALGCELVKADEVQAGEPDRVCNEDVFDGGAWVPLYNLPQEMTATGLPTSPNIFRAMGLVPSAIAHFFGVMRAHYALADLDFAIDRSQTELIAARVSSLNECFYWTTSHTMLLSLSGQNTSQDFNLDVVTNAGEGEIGVPHEVILLKIAEAVYNGEERELALVREEGLDILGPQALVDAIAVASGFNGITKVANATGLPLDETTENSTVKLRQQTKINDYTDAYKSELYRR